MQKQQKKIILEAKDVSKKYGNRIILDNINLQVYQGEILGIIGQNGSGKTTLLKMLVGFLHPDTGNILFDQKDLAKNQKKLAINFGFAAQENSFYPNLATEENIRYFGSLYNISKKTLDTNTKTVLDLVKLNDSADVLAKHLSTGMQRRLDIACSLINNPRILILDEPTENLDVMLRHEILDLIARINSHGTTIIMSSHLLEDIEQTSDSVAILYKHTIIKQGPLSMLRSLSRRSSLEDIFESLVKNG